MKKIIKRYMILATLIGCLAFTVFANFNTNPPCPENCYSNCAKDFDACKVSCGTNNKCINACINTLNACNAYCDWVCG